MVKDLQDNMGFLCAFLLVVITTTSLTVNKTNGLQQTQISDKPDAPIPFDRLAVWMDLQNFGLSAITNKSDASKSMPESEISRQLEWIGTELGAHKLVVPIRQQVCHRNDTYNPEFDLINQAAKSNAKNRKGSAIKKFTVWLSIDFEFENHVNLADERTVENLLTTQTTILWNASDESNLIFPGTVSGILVNFSSLATAFPLEKPELILTNATRILKESLNSHHLQLGIIFGENDWYSYGSNHVGRGKPSISQVDMPIMSLSWDEEMNSVTSNNNCKLKENLSACSDADSDQLNMGMLLQIHNQSTFKMLPMLRNFTKTCGVNGLVVLRGIDFRSFWERLVDVDVTEPLPTPQPKKFPIFLIFYSDKSGFRWEWFLGFFGLSCCCYCCCACCKEENEMEEQRGENDNAERAV